MIVTFTITTATVVIGSLVVITNAGMSWVSRKQALKRQKAQHDYETKALQEGHEAAMKQFNELCDVKREIASEEFQKNIDYLYSQQKQSIHDAAYFASLDEWPLHVPPMVMRNDNLFVPKDKSVSSNIVMQIEPVHIIMAPCSDVFFRNSFHSGIENNLSSFFETFWGPSSWHPVIFYQQAWKNKTKDADDITIKNMYSKIGSIPTIIVNPVVGKDSLRFETSFWNIIEDNRGENTNGAVFSLPIEFPKSIYQFKANKDYPECDRSYLIQELSSFLESMLSMLVDQYSWRRYHYAPNQTEVIKGKGLLYNKDEIKSLAEDYILTLQDSIKNADVFFVTDTNKVLSYCINVDSLVENGKCFYNVLKNLIKRDNLSLEEILVSLPFYGCEFEKELLTFCKLNRSLYNISSTVIQKLEYKYIFNLMTGKTEEEIIKSANRFPYNANEGKQTKIYDELLSYVDTRHDLFWKRCNSSVVDIINKSRELDKWTDKRDWARPKISRIIKEKYLKEIEYIIQKSEQKILQIKGECINKFVDNVFKDFSNVLEIDNQTIAQASENIKENLKKKYLVRAVWKPEEMTTLVLTHSYSNAVVNTWIDYKWLDNDIVRYPNEITEDRYSYIKKCFDDEIWHFLRDDTINEINDILDGNNNKTSSNQSDSGDYSSSDSDWDPVSEVLLDNVMY